MGFLVLEFLAQVSIDNEDINITDKWTFMQNHDESNALLCKGVVKLSIGELCRQQHPHLFEHENASVAACSSSGKKKVKKQVDEDKQSEEEEEDENPDQPELQPEEPEKPPEDYPEKPEDNADKAEDNNMYMQTPPKKPRLQLPSGPSVRKE